MDGTRCSGAEAILLRDSRRQEPRVCDAYLLFHFFGRSRSRRAISPV